MKDRMNRRGFLRKAMILAISAASVMGFRNLDKGPMEPKPEFPRTSRKKAKHYRELAG